MVAAAWDVFRAPFFGAPFFGGSFLGARDVEAEIDLSVEEAYTGGRCRVVLDTPAGTRGHDILIPPGVTDGQRLRLAGNVYLVVRLVPDRRYRVSGRDLTVDLPVAPWEAALGVIAPVTTPAGTVRVAVPPGSSSGARLRVPGRGLPNPYGTPGDLYAEIKIAVPAHLTAAERDLFTRLSQRSTFNPRKLPGSD